MRILGIDTTRKVARMFVYDDTKDNKEYHIQLNENIKHSEGAFLYMEKILHESKLNLEDFDYFSAMVGPGSFTGIRVGMSIMKGFNKCFNKILIPVNIFELFANDIKNGIVLINSTTNSCYYGKIENKELIESGVVDKNKIIELVDGKKLYILKEEQMLINPEYNNIVIIDNIDKYYVPAILSKINSNNIDKFEPFYIQLSQAERNMKND